MAENTTQEAPIEDETLSPEALLTALTRVKFSMGKKDAHLLYKERTYTRHVKLTLIVINSFALVLAIFALLTFFNIGTDLPYGPYKYTNVALVGVALGLDIFFLFKSLIPGWKLSGEIKRGEKGTYAYYFLKDLIAIEIYHGVEAFSVKEPGQPRESLTAKEQVRYTYKDIYRLLETPNYFWMEFVDGKDYFFLKSAAVKRKLDVDELSGKIMEESGRGIYIAGKDADMHYKNCEEENRKNSIVVDLVKMFDLILGIFYGLVLLANFRSGLDLDYVFLGWVGLGLFLAFLIPSFFLRLSHPSLNKKGYKGAMWVLSVFGALYLVFAILGSLYDSLTGFEKRSIVLKNETGLDYLPTGAVIDSSTSYHNQKGSYQDPSNPEVFYSLYLRPLEADLNNDTQIEILESHIASDTEQWQASIKPIYISWYMPLNIPTSSYNAYMVYAVTLGTFFPKEALPNLEDGYTSIQMETICYNTETNHILLLSFNVVNGHRLDLPVVS